MNSTRNMLNAGKQWTPTEEEQLLQRLQQNWSYLQIAREHNRSIRAIEMRVETLIRKHCHAGCTKAELVSTFKKTPDEIDQIMIGERSSNPMDQRLQRIEDMLEKLYKKQKQMLELLKAR